MHGDEKNTLAKREAEKFKEEQLKIEAERTKLLKAGHAKGFQKLIQESDVAKPPAVLWFPTNIMNKYKNIATN